MGVVMLVLWRERKRGAAIVLAAGLAAVALAAVLAAVAMARPLAGFIHIRTNLSQAATLVSAHPDLVVSPDGDRVVAVWTEGYNARAGFRGHVYLRAASETGGGWGSKIPVFSGDDSACAYAAAVAVTGDTAHVAYVVFEDTCNDPNRVQVRYRTCSLTSGQCSSEQAVFTELTHITAYVVTHVDIALDEDGDPHIVWAQYADDGSVGDVWYNTRSAGVWGSEKWVDESNKVDRRPAIAWADGYAHVAWETEQVGGGEYYLRYRRRDDESGAWSSVVSIVGPQHKYPPGNPDVAAGAGRVFVVWDWCAYKDLNNEYCLEYNLVYGRSAVTGSMNFDWREVGTDAPTGWDNYYSTDNVYALPDNAEYLLDLRPSIALNDAGWPAVVWHANRSSGDVGIDYAVYYSYALTGTEAKVYWITPTVLSQGQATVLGAAVVGVGEPEPGGEQHLHVAYMQKLGENAWDVYYNSNEEDRYEKGYLPLVMRTY